MDEGLPKSFDVVIVGTGVTESIVSAAVSRNGHSVLHLDPHEFYGSFWTTLNFDSWTSEEFASTPCKQSSRESLEDDSGTLDWISPYRDVEQIWYDSTDGIKEDFKTNKRRFNIDVFPQVVLAREDLIELLIKSDVSRYLEFLRVGKLFTSLQSPNENVITSIPLSRSDIFTSKSVSLAEKRCLVKFIEAIMKTEQTSEEVKTEREDESVDKSFQTFEELAKIYNLSPKIKHLMKSVIQTVEDGLCSDPDTTFNNEFVPRCRKFLQSIGRFANQTPYLWTLYGISEICQAFCRLSAVYGGIFILKRFISKVKVTENGELSIKSEDDEFTAKHLVIGQEFEFLKSGVNIQQKEQKRKKTLGRGVIVTIGPNMKVEEQADVGVKGDGICFYTIGKLQVVELNHLSQAVPKNYRLLQVTFPVTETDNNITSVRQFIESGLLHFVDFDFVKNVEENQMEEVSNNDNSKNDQILTKPKAVFASYFWMDLFESNIEADYSNIHSCAVSSASLNPCIKKAMDIFARMYPGEEFLPKPPEVVEEQDVDDIDDNVADNQNEEAHSEMGGKEPNDLPLE